MKVQIVVFFCLAFALALVQGQNDRWTRLKCGMENQKLYDRTLGLDTCNDYCVARISPGYWRGQCEINNGYGECRCYLNYVG